VLPLSRRHGVDDALHARYGFFGCGQISAFGGLLHLGGELIDQRRQASHIAHLPDLHFEIIQIKAAACLKFLGHFFGRF
jgi:hypothetical protein